MNVSLRKHFFLLFLLAVSVSAWGQQRNVSITTSQGTMVKDTITAISGVQYTPTVVRGAINGFASLNRISSNKVEVTYTPNADFIGGDSFRIQIFTCSFCLEFLEYTVNVTPSNIVANHDYAFSAENTTVSIDVTANDESSNGVVNLTAIPLTNNGNATFTQGANTIEFTPAPDFEGIAYFNYVICNGAGLCDNGTVTIQVLGDNASLSDTLQIFTKKNSAQIVLVPNTFVLTDSPQNGTYAMSGDAPTYSPAQDFTGRDYIRFQNGSTSKVVEVVVIDAEDNLIAFDDEAYTSPANPVEINTVENDLYGAESGCFSVQAQPQFGTIEASEDGIVTYYPNSSFLGVDWFTYTVNAPGCGAAEETATVYIYVSNFEPSQTKFRMNTPKNTPLVIGNNVPISNFMYRIKDQGDLGKTIILDGQRDTTINNTTISGKNLILYIPNDNVTAGIDELEITYCVLSNSGNCAYEKSIKVEVNILDIVSTNQQAACFNDCVWPGDTNLDGVVDMADLLPIGLAMGELGTPRSETDFSTWYGQQGNDWNTDMNGEVNLKHIDTDGDSIVTALDTSAIAEFYGYTHGLTSAEVPFSKNTIILDGDIFVSPGDMVEMDIVLGVDGNPALDVYGFTFPFEYSPLIFQPETVEIDFSGNSWLSYNSPSLYMTQNNEAGRIDAGYTRTSGISASGFGKIGKLRLVVVEDINGFRPGAEEMIVDLGGGTALGSNSAGQNFSMNIQSTQIHIVPRSAEEIANTPLTADLLKTWPNPTQNLLNVHLNGGQEFERVMIYNITGQVAYDSGNTLARRTQIDVGRLQNGMYVLSVVTPTGVINKKFEVLR